MGARPESPRIAEPRPEPLALWSPRQRRFTKIVAVSGVAAWIGYHVALSRCDPWALGPDVELSIFALAGQAIMFAGYLAVANVAYDLGRLALRAVRPRDAERFRRRLFVLGVALFAAAPWYVPISAEVYCLTADVPPPEALAPPSPLNVRMG